MCSRASGVCSRTAASGQTLCWHSRQSPPSASALLRARWESAGWHRETRHGTAGRRSLLTPWAPRACRNKQKKAPPSEWMTCVRQLWPSGFFCPPVVASFRNSCCGQQLPPRPQFGDGARAAHQERYFQRGLGLGGRVGCSQGTVSEPLQPCAVLCAQVLSTTRRSAMKGSKNNNEKTPSGHK